MPLPLVTERLAIRPLVLSDADALFAVWSDPEVMRYIPAPPATSVDEVRASITKRMETPGPLGAWAVSRRDDLTVVGIVALVPVARIGPEVEIAYHLRRDAWGRGYATEAAAACVAYGRDEAGLARILGLTFAENVASQRVLAKIGMVRVGLTERFYGRALVEHVWDA